MGFGESGGIIRIYNEKDMPTQNNPGKPNARYDLIKPGGKGSNGEKQSRWTDSNGYPLRDIDHNHSNDGSHAFPHRHDWIDGERGKGYIINDYGNKQFFD